MADGPSGGAPGDEPLTGLPAAALVDAAPDAIVVVGEHGEIVLVNRQVEELFGYARDDLVGQQVEVLIPGAARDAHRSHRDRYGRSPTTRSMGAGLRLLGRRKDGT